MKKLILAIKKADNILTLFKSDKDAKYWNKNNKNQKFIDVKTSATVMKALPKRAQLNIIEK